MKHIKIVKGDATAPTELGPKILCHVNNIIGAWGAGFVLSLSKRWPQPERQYKELFNVISQTNINNDSLLGAVQFVPVENDIIVANMLAQKFCGLNSESEIPLDYKALKKCLDQVQQRAQASKARVIAPRFGSGLAGGDPEIILSLIDQCLLQKNIDVTIYEL